MVGNKQRSISMDTSNDAVSNAGVSNNDRKNSKNSFASSQHSHLRSHSDN